MQADIAGINYWQLKFQPWAAEPLSEARIAHPHERQAASGMGPEAMIATNPLLTSIHATISVPSPNLAAGKFQKIGIIGIDHAVSRGLNSSTLNRQVL